MKINAQSELEYATPSVLDARFALADANYDALDGVFSLKCWTPESGSGPRKPRTWKAHLLRFEGVTECKIDVSEKLDHYELSRVTCRAEEKVVQLKTHYALTITLTVKQLRAELSDLNEARQDW